MMYNILLIITGLSAIPSDLTINGLIFDRSLLATDFDMIVNSTSYKNQLIAKFLFSNDLKTNISIFGNSYNLKPEKLYGTQDEVYGKEVAIQLAKIKSADIHINHDDLLAIEFRSNGFPTPVNTQLHCSNIDWTYSIAHLIQKMQSVILYNTQVIAGDVIYAPDYVYNGYEVRYFSEGMITGLESFLVPISISPIYPSVSFHDEIYNASNHFLALQTESYVRISESNDRRKDAYKSIVMLTKLLELLNDYLFKSMILHSNLSDLSKINITLSLDIKEYDNSKLIDLLSSVDFYLNPLAEQEESIDNLLFDLQSLFIEINI